MSLQSAIIHSIFPAIIPCQEKLVNREAVSWDGTVAQINRCLIGDQQNIIRELKTQSRRCWHATSSFINWKTISFRFRITIEWSPKNNNFLAGASKIVISLHLFVCLSFHISSVQNTLELYFFILHLVPLNLIDYSLIYKKKSMC